MTSKAATNAVNVLRQAGFFLPQDGRIQVRGPRQLLTCPDTPGGLAQALESCIGAAETRRGPKPDWLAYAAGCDPRRVFVGPRMVGGAAEFEGLAQALATISGFPISTGKDENEAVWLMWGSTRIMGTSRLAVELDNFLHSFFYYLNQRTAQVKFRSFVLSNGMTAVVALSDQQQDLLEGSGFTFDIATGRAHRQACQRFVHAARKLGFFQGHQTPGTGIGHRQRPIGEPARDWSKLTDAEIARVSGADPSTPVGAWAILACDETRVYHVDTECAGEGERAYEDLLAAMDRISGNALRVGKVTESWGEQVQVIAEVEGRPRRFTLEHLDDYLDTDIIRQVNGAVTGFEFHTTFHGGQDTYVVALRDGDVERLEAIGAHLDARTTQRASPHWPDETAQEIGKLLVDINRGRNADATARLDALAPLLEHAPERIDRKMVVAAGLLARGAIDAHEGGTGLADLMRAATMVEGYRGCRSHLDLAAFAWSLAATTDPFGGQAMRERAQAATAHAREWDAQRQRAGRLTHPPNDPPAGLAAANVLGCLLDSVSDVFGLWLADQEETEKLAANVMSKVMEEENA